jgi:hypothetical protein
VARRTRPVPAALRVAALSVLGPRLFPICKWVVRYSRYGYYVTATRRVTHRHSEVGLAHLRDRAAGARRRARRHAPRARDRASPARPWLHGRRFHTPPRQRGTVTARPQPDPRPSARQHPVRCNRMIRDGYAYGTRGTSTLTDHGEPSPRGRGATRGATWCMACAVVSTCMHVEPRGATWSMKCAVVSICMQVEHGHAVHERTPNVER